MRRTHGVSIAAVATVVALAGGGRAVASADGTFPPLVLYVGDLTGDGADDIVVGQAREKEPTVALLRMIDGASGRVLWSDVVADVVLPVEQVSLGGGTRGVVLTSRVSSGATDRLRRSVRVRVVDGTGRVRWDRTFVAHDIVPTLLLNNVRPAVRGVVRVAEGVDAVLVESAVRVEAGAGRVTRLTALMLDAGTGTTRAEHGPYDVVRQAAKLVPVPDVGTGHGDFGVVTHDYPGVNATDGTLTTYDAVTGAQRWQAKVRSTSSAEVVPLLAGVPPRPAVAVASGVTDLGVQLLDRRTGAPLAQRDRGGTVVAGGGAGPNARIRTQYLNHDGERNGYTVELLDLAGATVARRVFTVGTATTYGYAEIGLYEAGDVDGDGWGDLLAHASFAATGARPAHDHRLVDGRTLSSVEVARNTEDLVWIRPGSAAVDGRGDDLYATTGKSAQVLDGRTMRPLLRLSSRSPMGSAVAVRDPGATCADVLVVTYGNDDFGLTRLGPRGERRWVTGHGAVTARDVSGRRGCATARPAPAPLPAPQRPRPATPRGPTIPETGGLPGTGLAMAVAAAAVATARRRRSG